MNRSVRSVKWFVLGIFVLACALVIRLGPQARVGVMAAQAQGGQGPGLLARVPTGSLLAFAGSTAPSGYQLCDGHELSRATYAALFAVIGTTYGAGDGATTFNAPDLRGRAVFGGDTMGGTAAGRLTQIGSGVGSTGGHEKYVLGPTQMPAHNHPVNDPGHAHAAGGYADSITGNIFGGTHALLYTNGDAASGCCVHLGIAPSRTGITTGAAGGSDPISVVPPAMAVNYLIKE